MKALILAAGLGTRLAPLTNDKPKCMTLIHGKSIIENQIESIIKAGISDITIVGGYLYNELYRYISEKFKNINFIHSINYDTTNNMYSAWLAKDFLQSEVDGFIMMNADVFVDQHIIMDLIKFNYDNAIVTDIGNYLEESMKVVEERGFLVEISKTIPQEKALGNSIDIYKFSKAAGDAFFNTCENYIINKNEKKLWSEVALNDILSSVHFKACPLNGRWYEIDTLEDLAIAEKIFAN